MTLRTDLKNVGSVLGIYLTTKNYNNDMFIQKMYTERFRLQWPCFFLSEAAFTHQKSFVTNIL